MERMLKTGILGVGLVLVIAVVLQPRIFGNKEEAPAALPAAATAGDQVAPGASSTPGAAAAPVSTPNPAEQLQARLEADPKDVDAWRTMGDLLLASQEYSGAAEAFAAVLDIKPDDAAAHAGLGDALLYQGMVRVARGEYRRALQLDPSKAQVHLNLGITLSHATPADLSAAAAAWKQVLILAPGTELARQAQAYLDTYGTGASPTPTVSPTQGN